MPPARRRPYPVRARILAAILAVTALGLVAAGSVAFLLQRARLLDAIDDELRQEFAAVQMLVQGSGTAPAVGTDAAAPAQAQTSAEGFARTEDLLYEVVRLATPALGGGSIGLIDAEAVYVPGIASSLDLNEAGFLAERVRETAQGGTVIGAATLHGEEIRYLAVPLHVEGDRTEGLFLSAISVPLRTADLRSVMVVYSWVALAVLVVVALVGWFVAGRLLRPVRELRQTAARITAGALDERIPVNGNDDLSELTETINAMIARLESAFTAQRRIVNDVRHELATPVTIVRGHLELVDPSDPSDVAETRALALDELDRMAGLVAQIADLAEAERAAAHRPSPVLLEELTQDVFAKVRVIPGQTWALGGTATGPVVVDPERITQAWLQLADNAAKHSPPGTRIEIASARRGDEVLFLVRDEGPGIPEAARERIFERFGRAESSRGVAGSGLGLSIADALARAHGGRIELESMEGRGSTFTIVVPATREDTAEENS